MDTEKLKQEIMSFVDEITEVLSKEDYVELLDEVISDLEAMQDAIKEELNND